MAAGFVQRNGRGTLAMQRLGVRLIERRGPEDAIVLGDAMQQAGLEGLITGRSRPVMFRTTLNTHAADAYQPYSRIATRDEQRVITRTRIAEPTFFVQGYEVIYNVGRFAAKPDEERWNRIWTMWVTPQRAIYRALIDAQLLPRSIRWRELRWNGGAHLPADVALAYRLFLERIPPKRKRPIDAYMFSIGRRDEDNPRTWEQHFDDPRS